MNLYRPPLACPVCGEAPTVFVSLLLVQMVALYRPPASAIVLTAKCKCRKHIYNVRAEDIRGLENATGG